MLLIKNCVFKKSQKRILPLSSLVSPHLCRTGLKAIEKMEYQNKVRYYYLLQAKLALLESNHDIMNHKEEITSQVVMVYNYVESLR